MIIEKRSWKQSGNILFTLFAVLGLIGIAGAGSVALIKGPVRGMSDATRVATAKNDISAAMTLLSRQALGTTGADCDSDGKVEPIPFRSAGSLPKPAGGGYLPQVLGVTKTDPWRSEYGYCVWDHGTVLLNTSCGGAGANRMPGGDTSAGIAVAVISAGPDRTFQTSCANWVNDATASVTKVDGSDDIVETTSYEKLVLPSGGDAKLEELQDEVCTPQNIGIMRRELGVVQVCMDTGWEEIGTSAQADTNFINVDDAQLNTVHTSNQIAFTGFLNEKSVSVTGLATLLVNGTVRSMPTSVVSGDKISLRAAAMGTPEQEANFEVSVGGVKRAWKITTRDYYAASISISVPGNIDVSKMDVRGPLSPAYGSVVQFLVTNTGELPTDSFSAAELSPSPHFEIHPNVTDGDLCKGNPLAPGASCVVDVRPKAIGAHDRTTYSETLEVKAGSLTRNISIGGTASGWTCTPPWGGARIPHGTSVTAYSTSSVAYNATCTQETRTCNADVLSGSYIHQTCTPIAALNCSLPWGGTLNHGSSTPAYAAANVAFGDTCSQQSRTCTNGNLSGTYTAQNCCVMWRRCAICLSHLLQAGWCDFRLLTMRWCLLHITILQYTKLRDAHMGKCRTFRR